MDFEIPVFGKDADSFEDYEYLFWVGCAGAYEDRAKKTTKAVAELLATAGVKFMVLGADETCTGDSARRAGNEFLFQQLAMQNIEMLNSVFDGIEQKKRKIVVTCAHCFNALGNEYPEVGGDYEVVHHTQLLNRLVRQKKLIPVASVSEDVTYHDPCFLGRHNKVYDAPRELMEASGSKLVEMPRHGERSMCCGAGGARMWMEENIGKRINVDRVDEALSTNPKKIATGCPFCRVMLTDGVTARQEQGQGEGVEVVDVAQLMLNSVTRLDPAQLGENIKVIPREKAPVAAEAKAETVEQDRVAEVEEAAATPEAKAAPAGKGLAMKGLAKAPGAKAPGAKAPGKGLGMAGGAKAPGAKKAAPPQARKLRCRRCCTGRTRGKAQGARSCGRSQGSRRQGTADEGRRQGTGAKAAAAPAAEAPAAEAPAAEAAAPEAAAPVAKPKGLGLASGAKAPGGKGLQMKGGAKAPGAKAAPAAAAPEAPAAAAAPEAPTEAPAAEAPAAQAEAPKAPPVAKAGGLGFKSGAKAPGARKASPAASPAPAAEAPATKTEPVKAEPAADAPAEASAPAEAAAPAAAPPAPKQADSASRPVQRLPAARSKRTTRECPHRHGGGIRFVWSPRSACQSATSITAPRAPRARPTPLSCCRPMT
ncbi:hypothetical protein GCM10020255_057640 [Rhodococcus baikonurensis]